MTARFYRFQCSSCKVGMQKIGQFVRKSDGRRVQRFRCPCCGVARSDGSDHPCYRQNKRHLNSTIRALLSSSVSQRRIALVLGISRRTVARKFEFLAKYAEIRHENFLKKFVNEPIKEIFLDEMEDRVHTKCKPVAIALIVTKDRKILNCQVSRIRPKNRNLHLISKKKYPKWTNNSREGFRNLLTRTAPLVSPDVTIRSDQKQMYHDEIERILPEAQHKRYKSRKAVIAGHGELKVGGRDPLFELNHTCAMLRANINRLVRRTWSTSKKTESLLKHIYIYADFHNSVLT